MTSWNSRGLRGSIFEEMINRTNEKYMEKKLALIQKIPTPITPTKIDSNSHQITLAYFEKQSTVDYIGVVQGIPVCFDAKECHTNTFPLQNIHQHQIDFMKKFEEQKGIAFLLIYYTHLDKYYYLRLELLLKFWERAGNGGRKSFRLEETEKEFFFKDERQKQFVPYLEMLQKDLLLRD
ncbi:recombination protein U [Acetitomaculum ruminis DSM 5522]|uniref:Holliday junction resolvase RecU n=1 Tax=Acetitomaculum ruminis DSM 5522 TaxID=1120918 RepID=A0A1I0V9R2_9FIRM|nr:Holliday junction resolvase RecU [Acetitomaculum ruminis]SFA72982.1 recombination protein U [Acetitomaculum ruminis DSM 5522]